MIVDFEFIEDREFFKNYLSTESEEDLDKYRTLFDFRPNSIKRREFNRDRSKIFADLKKLHGLRCFLNYTCCDSIANIVIDHLIPLTTNKLNKELRQLKPAQGKKVKSQNFGSNHIDNLILACEKCNSFKKHKFLDKQKLKEILEMKRIASR